ncbi:MAG: hypothetical protein LBH44_12480 [Treponema sp.]|jgi:hypothetical protein|nr:hypothetical protein [Treponema sp.]
MAKENVFVDDPVQRKITEDAILELNQKSYFGYDFLIPLDKNIKEKLQIECNGNWITNFMSNDYYGDNITWTFSGYPYDECSFFLTQIDFSSTQYHVFGIKPGDDMQTSLKVLSNFGFEQSKGDLSIQLKHHSKDNSDHSKIGTITVNVKTGYLGNRIY